MKPIILLFSLILTSITFAQTKLIAFRSHSGNMANFYTLVVNRAAEMDPHNLGAAPMKIVRTAALDSVEYIDDTTTVMYTSVYCKDEYEPDRPSWLWNPGADTLVNDEFWNQQDPKQIKKELKKEFNFQNNMDSVVFVGFPSEVDEVKPEPVEIDKNREAGGYTDDQNEEVVPPISNDRTPGMGIPMAILAVSVIAIALALFSWRRSHFKDAELA